MCEQYKRTKVLGKSLKNIIWPNPPFFVWNPLLDNFFQLFSVTMDKLFSIIKTTQYRIKSVNILPVSIETTCNTKETIINNREFGYFITLLKIKFLVSKFASKKNPYLHRHQLCANMSTNRNLFKTGPSMCKLL